MPNKPQHGIVSVRDIAARVGCSHASVSRALRGEKKVGAELRKKILKAADEMGYRPNPMIASLMATHNRKRERGNLTANICWLNTHYDENFWHVHSYTYVYRKAAEERARELGYGFEELWLDAEGMTGKRLSDIAEARGIQGFIIPGPVIELFKSGFEHENFAITCLRDYSGGQLEWNRATSSNRTNVQLTVKSLIELGYKRIAYTPTIATEGKTGFCELIQRYNAGECREFEIADRHSISASMAGFLFMQTLLPAADRIPPFVMDRNAEDFKEACIQHFQTHKPDVVICNDHLMVEIVTEAGFKVPDDLAIAHTNLGEDVPDWAGINVHPDRQASAAVEMLAGQIERNERGVPPFPKYLQIEGEWVDGWTVPRRK